MNWIDESIKTVQKEVAYNIISREISNIIVHISDILEDAFTNLQQTPYEIVLSGGGADLATLLQRVQSELGIPVRVLKPFGDETSRKISSDVFLRQSSYVTIFGLLVGQTND